MSDLQAVTGQLYIVDGTVQEISLGAMAPGLWSQPPAAKAARGRDRDYLFVHLTLAGTAAENEPVTTHLLGVLSQAFYKTSGSVTAALRTAVLEVNEQLLRHNISSGEALREGAISCTVYRQGELFTLQVGEAIALLGHNYGIERMPPRQPDSASPLGRSRGLDMRYYHHRLQPGDMLLLADPRVGHLSTEDFSPALVESDVRSGLEQLTAIVGADSVRLLLVEFATEAPVSLPEMRAAEAATIAAATSEPQPRRESVAATAVASDERQPQPVRGTPAHRQPAAADDKQPVEAQARRAGATAALGASRFTAWLADVLVRLRPPREPEEEKVNWTTAAIVAMLIPILVAIIVTGSYVARDQAQVLSDVKVEMNTKLAAASAAPEEEARQYYADILVLAEEARTELRPGDQEVVRIQTIAREELDRLDGVTRLQASPFYQYSEGTSLKSIALRDGNEGGLFTLDAANGFVYEHETDEDYATALTDVPLQVIFPGQSVGSRVIESITDFFWRPQGFAVQRDGLAMLDAGGALVTFQTSLDSSFAVPLDLSVDWVNPVAITDFDERIYILDPGASAIWKYFPDGEDFIANADERTIVFSENIDLSQAVDFDIYSEDGSLVIVFSDGRVRYYDTRNGRLEWDESTMLANGLSQPLLQPTAVEIVGRGLNATIFIADAGDGRIVQVSRPTGQVLAQYRASDIEGAELLAGMTDFAVAELPLRLFVTKGDTVYRATQP